MHASSLFSIWFRPRTTISRVADEGSKFTFFGLMALLTLIFIGEIYFFLWLLDFPKFAMLFQWQGIVLFGLAFILMATSIYTLLTSAALFVWLMAKSLGGVADIIKTRTALLWSAVTLLPIGILASLLLFIERSGANIHPDALARPGSYIFAEKVCFLALFAAVIYPLVHCSKSVSEVHKISFWQSLIALLFGAITGTFLVVFLFKIMTPFWNL